MAREEGCWAQILNGAAKAKTKTNLRIILSPLEPPRSASDFMIQMKGK